VHIFLTGAVQVGKSTAIRRFLENHPELKIGGFRTEAATDGQSVHLLPYVGGALGEDNRIMRRRGKFPNREVTVFPQVFDRLGAELLQQSRDCDIILMDEIGFAENEALNFHAAVMETLSGNVPVLGVLRGRPTVLGDKVRQRENVRIITVTEENRDEIPKELEQWLS
jgi:nucleoside-triphosphatase